MLLLGALVKRYPTITPHGIYGFFQEYRFLSNFEHSYLRLEGSYADGICYPTAEHAYMALKSEDLAVRQAIADLATPREARDAGQLITLRPNWDAVKPLAMLATLRAKFRQNPVLAEELLRTNNRYLEETNNWGDVYWGVCEGEGLNMLGKTLMQVRAELVEARHLEAIGNAYSHVPGARSFGGRPITTDGGQ